MVDWNSGMEWWTGMVEWNGGMEWTNWNQWSLSVVRGDHAAVCLYLSWAVAPYIILSLIITLIIIIVISFIHNNGAFNCSSCLFFILRHD